MISSLESVVQRLVEQYDPDRIIVFGSHATGRARAGSDIDLLVVKETNLRPIDRRMEVERILADRNVPLDLIVYTPSEVRSLYSAGSPFIEEVLRTGKVIFMRKVTKDWIEQARDELDAARILFDNAKFQPVCYHSQQSVEKGMKALVLEKAAPLPRTHDIVDLRNRVLELGWKISMEADEAVFLNSVYRGRYPTEEGLLPHGEPTREDAERAIRAAEKFIDSADAALNELEANSSSGEPESPVDPPDAPPES